MKKNSFEIQICIQIPRKKPQNYCLLQLESKRAEISQLITLSLVRIIISLYGDIRGALGLRSQGSKVYFNFASPRMNEKHIKAP